MLYRNESIAPYIFVALFLAVCTPSLAQAPPPGSGNIDFTGFVRVIDGDTVEIRLNGNRVGIGLIGVDAPQGNTACGQRATEMLYSLVIGGVLLEEDLSLPYDARQRRMYRGMSRSGKSIARELIRAGLALPQPEGKEAAEVRSEGDEARRWKRGCVHEEHKPIPTSSASLPVDADRGTELQTENKAVTKALSALSASGFSEEVVAGNLNRPTAIAALPDGRILVAEQPGMVRLIKNGVLQATPFLDLRSQVNGYWDRGLLGIAADPNFSANGYVYLLFTYENNALQYDGTKTGRLIRVTASGDTASLSTAVILLGNTVGATCDTFPAGTDCIPSDSPSHSVGHLSFGPNGVLFVSLGDGAHFNTVDDRALRVQNLDLLAGKILRINTSGAGVSGNPFWTGTAIANRSKVWAYGVRNPFRFSLHPASGTPYIGDVGWNNVEEINVAQPGANFGWPCYEGTSAQSGYQPKPVCQSLYQQGAAAVTNPLVNWAHNGSSASAVGGVFYSGSNFPSSYLPSGGSYTYFYGDYSRGWIRHIRVNSSHQVVAGPVEFATGTGGPVCFNLAADGTLLYLSIGTGQLRRIRYTSGNTPPQAVASASPISGSMPLAVQFTGSASSDGDGDPLQFSWDFGDGSATSTTANPQHTYNRGGAFTARLTVTDGRGGTSSASVVINVGNLPPVVSITSPESTHRYRVGELITGTGSATDPEDGTIPETSLAWDIIIQHCPGGLCHEHVLLTGTGGRITFTVPDHGDDSSFEMRLKATDRGGVSSSATLTLLPQLVDLSLAASASGLNLVYDGQTDPAPVSRSTVVGSAHTIQAPSPQTVGSVTYRFASWSDGGAQQHSITTPSSAATFTARFTGSFPVTPATATLSPNMTRQFTAPVGVVWSISPQVGTISASGLYTAPPSIQTSTTVSVLATKSDDPSVTGTAVITLTADATPPVISSIAVTAITGNSATISWRTNEPADSTVAYDLKNNMRSAIQRTSATQTTTHSITLTGLSPLRNYYFRASSKDANGNTATSPVQQFRTTK